MVRPVARTYARNWTVPTISAFTPMKLKVNSQGIHDLFPHLYLDEINLGTVKRQQLLQCPRANVY
jgi:hypothetical protein